MIDRGLAIFSGFSTRIVAKVRPQLKSMAIDAAFVQFDGEATHAYFNALVARTLELAQRAIVRDDVRLSTFLVSALQTDQEKLREGATFFPAVRRLAVAPELRNDINGANAIVSAAIEAFRSAEHKAFVKSMSVGSDARFLLPVRNTPCKHMVHNFQQIYERATHEISQRVSRYIVRPRSRPGYRIKDLMFVRALNNGTHPIRRCTDSATCDLKAFMRFGLNVPERLEFDVSCETGLRGKTFEQCDGQINRITKEVSHLNMRINDDHKEG